MRQVSILKTVADLKTLEIRDVVVTAFLVTPSGIEEISIEEERVPRTLKLVDPATGEGVTLEDDPLRWAELLPTAYRSGDYRVAVDVADEAIELASRGSSETDEVAELVSQF